MIHCGSYRIEKRKLWTAHQRHDQKVSTFDLILVSCFYAGMYKKYFEAWKRFRDGFENKPEGSISLEMHRAARDLSQSPVSECFPEIAKALEDGTVLGHYSQEDREAFIKVCATAALMMNIDHEAAHDPNPPSDLDAVRERLRQRMIIDGSVRPSRN